MCPSDKILPIILIFLGLLSCNSPRDNRLLEVAFIVSDWPKEAHTHLDKIAYDSLSESDRHYYDFLSIKANDKAYILHTSDSLILDVIAYASTHRNEGYYPEALYYGGRVYADLGDSPTALRYFHEALDILPDNTENLELRTRILSQTGRLLNVLNLPDEAVSYLREAIATSGEDTLGRISDLQLLGHTYISAKEYEKAQIPLKEALKLDSKFNGREDLLSRMYLAQAKYKTNDLDSAIRLIRNLPEQSDSLERNSALAYACNIYYHAGVLDSAYLYAEQLIHSSDPNHKEMGYYIILKPELRHFVPFDSIDRYYANYGSVLKASYNSNADKLAITQTALYNYQLQERERVKAEKREKIFRNWLWLAIAFISLTIFYIFYLKYRNKDRIIELQKTLNDVKELCQQLTLEKSLSKSGSEPGQPTEESLREEIRRQLLAAATEERQRNLKINSVISNSEPYLQILHHISESEIIKEKDPLWHELEKVVLKYHPEFRKKLLLLSSGKLNVSDFQLALLMKCGITPSQMTVVFGKSNGAIISRRDTLSKKLFSTKLPANVISNAIALL